MTEVPSGIDPARFNRAAPSDDVRYPGFLKVEVRNHRVLLSRLKDGTPVAFSRICPHQAKPLDDGKIWDDRVDCPHHHYTYDPRTGENVYPKRRYPAFKRAEVNDIRAYEVREADGWVWVGPRKDLAGGDSEE